MPRRHPHLGMHGARHGQHGPPRGDGRRLSDLRPGETAKLVRVCGRGPCRRRMMDMGLVPGETVEVLRLAPLGDPLEIKVRDCCISLRREEASRVEVEACS